MAFPDWARDGRVSEKLDIFWLGIWARERGSKQEIKHSENKEIVEHEQEKSEIDTTSKSGDAPATMQIFWEEDWLRTG